MGQQDDPNTGASRNEGTGTQDSRNEGIEDFGQGGRESGTGGATQEGAWRPADADDDIGQNPMSENQGGLGSTGGGGGATDGGDIDRQGAGVGSAQGGS